MHFPHVHWPTWRTFVAWAKDTRPDVLVWLGDFLDLESLSRFAPEPGDNVCAAPSILQWIAAVKDLAPFVGEQKIIEGNHEARYYKKVIAPVARELYGMDLTLQKQCRDMGLPEDVEWRCVDKSWPGYWCGQVLLRHGHEDEFGRRVSGKHLAYNALVKSGFRSMVFGHHHRQQMYCQGTSERGTIYALTNPHMGQPVNYSPDPDWVRGWTVLHLDTERNWAFPCPVLCENGRTIYAGKLYDGNDDSVGAMKREDEHNAEPIMVTLYGVTKRHTEWARQFGIGRTMLRKRLLRGMSPVDAVTLPPTDIIRRREKS